MSHIIHQFPTIFLLFFTLLLIINSLVFLLFFLLILYLIVIFSSTVSHLFYLFISPLLSTLISLFILQFIYIYVAFFFFYSLSHSMLNSPPPPHTHTHIYIYIYFEFLCIIFSCLFKILRGWYNFFSIKGVDTIYFCVSSCYLFFVFFRIIWCLLIYISFLLFFFSSYLFQNLNSAISFILLKYLYFLSIFLFKKIKYKIFYLNSNK